MAPSRRSINQYKDMIFLPIETSGEGEVNAHSRVQMALGEAKAKARLEFEAVPEAIGPVARRDSSLRRRSSRAEAAVLSCAAREGVAGTAAQFVLHVGNTMDRDAQVDPAQPRCKSTEAAA